MLGYHPDITQHRHEIVVAFPAWNNVKVQMRFDARARRLAEVVSEVKSVGFHAFAKNGDAPLTHPEQLGALFFSQFFEIPHVTMGDHHQMTVRVGIFVHDDVD